MNKGNLGCPTPGTWRLINKVRSLLLEMLQRRLDRSNGVGDMVETLPIAFEKLSNRSIRAKRLKQLNKRASKGDHGFLHALLRDLLPVESLDPIPIPVSGNSRVEIAYSDPDMIEVDQLHDREAIAGRG